MNLPDSSSEQTTEEPCFDVAPTTTTVGFSCSLMLSSVLEHAQVQEPDAVGEWSPTSGHSHTLRDSVLDRRQHDGSAQGAHDNHCTTADAAVNDAGKTQAQRT